MRCNILIIATLILFGLSGHALADDSRISHIRKEYQTIKKSLPSLSVESRSLEGQSSEGGEAIAYRDKKGHVCLVKVQLYFESGKVFEEYYFEKGLLFFAYTKSFRYNVPHHVTPKVAKEIGGDAFDPKKTIVEEERYYFDRNKMLRWLVGTKKEEKPGSKEFAETERQVLGSATKVLSRFQRNP